MPARLYFSNSLEVLADHLLENLSGKSGDPFLAPALATPASSLRDWLKIRLAEKMKIAANIAFPHLENLLWDRLAERDRFREAADRQPARLLDTFSFQGLVLAQLRRAPPPELEAYLASDDPAEAARRLCQLSGRLASLFREYEYSRVSENGFAGVAESWSRGETCFEQSLLRGLKDHPARARLSEVRELEAWQMSLYRSVFREEEGLRDRWGRASGIYRYTLPQYAERALRDPLLPPRARTSPVYHLFGLSNISPFHRNLIGRLADAERLGEGAAAFDVYALNPCAEYWEDALTPRERRRLAPRRIDRARVAATGPRESEIRNAEIPDAPGENGMLSLFGKPGRETIKLWCQLTEYAFHEDFREPAGESLLSGVRKSILSRLPSLPVEERISQDDSLRIRSAPDARAEIELARAEAAERLRNDPGLRPEDLAIIPADAEAILPVIRAVFAGGADVPGNVPVLLPGAAATEDSPVLRGFRDLLSPGVAAADRNALLGLLENPAVLRKTKLEPSRLRAVRAFLEAAGFQEGWDAAAGTEADGGSALADAELRAVLAQVFDPADPALEAEGPWPAREGAGLLERDEIARLLEWLDALREALRPFRAETGPAFALTFPEWARRLRRLLDVFLGADAEDAADVRAEIDLRRFCAELGQWGEWNEGGKEKDGGVGVSLILRLFEDRFREPGADRAAFLRGGVRVGSLAALRGIPFRHVWITGLAADTFPAATQSGPLDLRAYRRVPGETDPAARDLYAFLEALAATTDSLTLSWPRRDPARDAERPASRALTGLAAWLESDVLPPGTPFRIDEAAHVSVPPVPSPSVLPPVAWAEEPQPRPVLADWAGLSDYLRNPAAHAALRYFNLRAYDALDFSEEERAAALFLNRWTDSEFLDAALRAELLEAGSGLAAFDRLWTPLARGGRVPPRPYGDIEAARLRGEAAGEIAKNAAAWREVLARTGLRFAGGLRSGPQTAAMARPPVISIPAFDASPLGIPARIGGILPWFFRAEGPQGVEGGWALKVEKDREFPAYLLQLCVAALDAPPLLRGPAHLFVRDKEGRVQAHVPRAPARGEAREILHDLLKDFLAAPDFDDLQIDAVEKIRRDASRFGRPVLDWGEEIRAQRREDEENPHARVPFSTRLLRALRTGTPENAERTIARRLQPYLDWKLSWETAEKSTGDA